MLYPDDRAWRRRIPSWLTSAPRITSGGPVRLHISYTRRSSSLAYIIYPAVQFACTYIIPSGQCNNFVCNAAILSPLRRAGFPCSYKSKQALMLKELGEGVGRLSQGLLAALRQSSVKPHSQTTWYQSSGTRHWLSCAPSNVSARERREVLRECTLSAVPEHSLSPVSLIS